MIDFVREHHCQKKEKNIFKILNHVHRKRHGHRSFYFNIEVAGYLIKIKRNEIPIHYCLIRIDPSMKHELRAVLIQLLENAITQFLFLHFLKITNDVKFVTMEKVD